MTDPLRIPRVLIIDPDARRGATVSAYLSEKGFSVLITTEGGHARSMVEKIHLDVILAHDGLARPSDLALLWSPTSDTRPAVIWVGEHPDLSRVVEALKEGADDYLVWPFAFSKLEETIERALKNRQSLAAMSRQSIRLWEAHEALRSQKDLLEKEKHSLEMRIRELATIHRIGDLGDDGIDLEGTLSAILDTTLNILSASEGGVLLFDPSSEYHKLAVKPNEGKMRIEMVGVPSEILHRIGHKIDLMNARDGTLFSWLASVMKVREDNATLFVHPLESKLRRIGLLILVWNKKQTVGLGHDQKFLSLLARESAGVIDRILLFRDLAQEREELLRRSQRLVQIHDLGQALTDAKTLDALADVLTQRLHRVMSYDLLLLSIPSEKKMWATPISPVDPLALKEWESEEITFCEKLVQGDVRLDRMDIASIGDGDVVDSEKLSFPSAGWRIRMPLRKGDRALGLLTLFRLTRSPIADPERRCLDLLSGTLMHALLRLEDRRRLAELATTDGLTHLLNRRAFLNIIHRKHKDSARYGTRISLLLLDIDSFKDINDRLGHPVGDMVLCHIAELLQKSVREVDVTTRFGGDEFALILPETPIDQAVSVADRIRRFVSGNPFMLGGEPIPLTISCGVSCCPDPLIRSIDDLILQADRALYAAKQAGRNRVEKQRPAPVQRRVSFQIHQLSI